MVPVGINPGFDYNPGQYRDLGVRAAFGEHVQRVVDWAPEVLAARAQRARVSEYVRGDSFRRFNSAAAETTSRAERSRLGDAPLAVVPPARRIETDTSEAVLHLPAAGAYQAGRRQGAGSRRAGWRRLDDDDWPAMQSILDTAEWFAGGGGRWVLLVKPYRDSGGVKFGYRVVLARDRANPTRLVPVSFYRINAAEYRKHLARAAAGGAG